MLKREENAVVLDFLPHGKSGEGKSEPTAQVLGDTLYTLLEVIVKEGIEIKEGDKVYIGRGDRDKIAFIKGRIAFSDLTNNSQKNALEQVKVIVKSREAEYVNFLNKAGAISIRLHSLELLPSIGKKHLSTMLLARDKQPFLDFKDVQSRVPHLNSVENIFVERILEELRGESKYYLFTKPPARDERY
ncbi:DUF655 domain-containing protein [Candidatus Micrarchaeota archaeon]|nr:DUF655 domain-containing protein [Candidatus Micrarchaeota archaeon]